MEANLNNSLVDVLITTNDINRKAHGDEYIKSLLEKMAKSLGIKYLMVGKPKLGRPDIIQTEFVWGETSFGENFEYSLEGTPCENVLSGRRVCVHSSGVAKLFPDDVLLEEMGVEAYVGAPILTPSGELLGLFAMLDDKSFADSKFLAGLTDFFASRIGIEYAKVKADEKLTNLNKELEAKVKEKTIMIRQSHEVLLEQNKLASLGRVVAGIAHEIRNPLGFILNSKPILKDSFDSIVELVDRAEGLDPKIQEEISRKVELADKGLELVEKHSLRIKDIMTKMLDQAKGDKLEKTNYDLHKTINDSFQFVYHASSFQSAGIEFTFMNNIPKNTTVSFTRDIQTVFINLFENALYSLEEKYAKSDQLAEIIVDLEGRLDGQHIISITDNGLGASGEVVRHMLEPFFTTKITSNGTGLGLSLVKNTMSKNDGFITATSIEGEGMRFLIEFSNCK